MRIAVMGTGGLGGYLGGRLAHAGQDVTFIARGQRLHAMRENGLQIRSSDGDFTIKPVRATDVPAEVGSVDLVLFCVKTYDAQRAAEMMRPLVGPQTAILPVLNGIEHLDMLSAGLDAEHVLGGMALVTVHSTVPGIVERIGRINLLELGEVSGEVSARSQTIEQIFIAAGIDAKAVPNILERMWWKFVIVCGAGVFAVVRGGKSVVWGTPETRTLLLQTITEALAVAHGQHIPLSPTFVEEYISIVESLPSQWMPSLLVDLEQGRRLEVEATNGFLSRLGKKLEIFTPANDFLYACLKPYVNGRPPTDH